MGGSGPCADIGKTVLDLSHGAVPAGGTYRCLGCLSNAMQHLTTPAFLFNVMIWQIQPGDDSLVAVVSLHRRCSIKWAQHKSDRVSSTSPMDTIPAVTLGLPCLPPTPTQMWGRPLIDPNLATAMLLLCFAYIYDIIRRNGAAAAAAATAAAVFICLAYHSHIVG